MKMNPMPGDKELSDLLDFSAVSISLHLSNSTYIIRNAECKYKLFFVTKPKVIK